MGAGRSDGTVRRPQPGSPDVETATLRYLMYVLPPAWFAPGLLDWWMHRRTDIEHTSGTRESVLHLAMISEVGAPVLLAQVLEVNPPLLALMGGAALAHEATAAWDVRRANHSNREVRPAEQNIHSFLESMPFMALAATACLHPRQVRALLHPRRGDPAWRLRLKRPPLPRRYLVIILGSVAAFAFAPYVEELYRCLRAQRNR
jgi:hypothetical protein